MTFRCTKCGTDVPVPQGTLGEGATVACPGCGARYRRRRRSTAATATQAPPSGRFAPTLSGDSDPATQGGTSGPQKTTITPPPRTVPSTGGEKPKPEVPPPPRPTTPSPPPPPPTSAADGPPSPSSTAVPSTGPQRYQPRFAPDDLVADRYRIIRFVAHGGMGSVYEAEDLELRERVALKTIRPDVGEAGTIERFKREIQLARKVTHPNVCRIFDVGHHHPPADGTSQGEGQVVFLTMEFLEGPTLTEKLRESGPMTPEAALPILKHVGRALHAAHQAGIVHRDFKSDNVMLVPSENGVRAVVTDFGVARGKRGVDKFADSVTVSGDLVGTPAYMAPEQVEGGDVTAATDVYALGIVIYEMVTGTVPFLSETPLATAAKRLTEAPASPRAHAPDLDTRWVEGILRCLERQPQDRFASAAEAVQWFAGDARQATLAERQALEEEKQRIRQSQRRLEQQRKKVLEDQWQRALEETEGRKAEKTQRLRLVLASVLVIASLFFAYDRIKRQLEKPSRLDLSGFPSGPIEARRSVAVLGFKNVSGNTEVAWLSTALAEMLSTELATGGQLRIIPGENVARMRVELALAEVDSLAKDTLNRIRSNLGTDYVVLGSYLVLSGELRLDLRLQDAASGATVVAMAENGSERELFRLVSQAGKGLREELNLDAGGEGASSSLPENPQAARLYAEGLEKLRLFDPLAARGLLERAAALEPGKALVHSALATARSSLGYQEDAKEAARKAYELSSQLPDEERLSVEGQYRVTAQDWGEAIKIYQRLWSAFPDNLEYGLQLAAAQTSAGQGGEALTTVEILHRLPEPASEDPRIDVAEAAAAASLSQYPQQQAAAAKAAEKGRELNAVLLVAQARVTEGEALRHLGRPDDARAACEEARRIYAETGNHSGEALALVEIGNILFAEGEYDGAKEMYQDSRDRYGEIGDQSGVLRALNNMAVVLRNQGELADAKKRYQEFLEISQEIESKLAEAAGHNNLGAVLHDEGRLSAAKERFEKALDIHQEIGNKSGEASAISNMAVVLAKQGNLDTAKRLHRDALRILRDIGQKTGEIASLNHLGEVLVDQGDLPGGEKMFNQALAMAREIGSKSLTADSLYGLGELVILQAKLPEARKHHEEALEIRRELGEQGAAAESQLAMAFLLLEEERSAQAGTLAEKMGTLFRAKQIVDQGARADVALAYAFLAQDNLSEARAAVERATELARGSESRGVRLAVQVCRGKLLAAEGPTEEADRTLEDALDQAREAGLLGLQFEAHLALGQLEARIGQTVLARSRLRSLEEEAFKKGYHLLARKAARVGL